MIVRHWRLGMPLALGWGGAIVLWLAAAIWVTAHPISLSSDDALFFSRGLSRFSVLDFSPQFPGYPGFIAMGRALTPLSSSTVGALALLSATVALSMPLAAAWATTRMLPSGAGGKESATVALLAFLFVMLQPLGPNLALSYLSDGAGILFVVIGLALLPKNQGTAHTGPRSLIAGIALGWALACRPTNLVLAVAASLAATLTAPRTTYALWIGGVVCLLPIAAILLIFEPLYLIEGQRFVQGHAEIWGNTVLSDTVHSSWHTSLAAHPWLALLLGFMAVAISLLPWQRTARGRAARMALVAAFWGHAIWMLGFQNPNNLRHLAPLMVFGGIGLALALSGFRFRSFGAVALLCLALVTLGRATVWDPALRPPLGAAARHLLQQDDQPPPVLVTNYGVQLMRAQLRDMRIYDAYYTGNAALGASLAKTTVWRLSGTKLPAQVAEQTFSGRFKGERDLFLYRLKDHQLH